MNITKKRLLKIKNTKNQSKKKFYSKYKKKYKINKSFRRRRKHNLQNKSLKKYKKLIKRKRKKKANKKGGNKIVIGDEIILNQIVPTNDNKFNLMPGRYSPITKTILLGDEKVTIKTITDSINSLLKEIEDVEYIVIPNYKTYTSIHKNIEKLKKNMEHLSIYNVIKDNKNIEKKLDVKDQINKLIDNFEKMQKFYFDKFTRKCIFDGDGCDERPINIPSLPTSLDTYFVKKNDSIKLNDKPFDNNPDLNLLEEWNNAGDNKELIRIPMDIFTKEQENKKGTLYDVGKISRFYKEKYGNAINNIKNNKDNKIKWYNYWKNFRKWILLWLNYSIFKRKNNINNYYINKTNKN